MDTSLKRQVITKSTCFFFFCLNTYQQLFKSFLKACLTRIYYSFASYYSNNSSQTLHAQLAN